VLTHLIVAGYLCFLPFVPSFLVTLVSSPLLIHPPPHAHPSRSRLSIAPSLFRGVGQKKERKKRKKESSRKKEKRKKKKIDRRTVQVGHGNRFVSVKEFCVTVSPGSQAFWAAPCIPW
jgi:hypothetical protein